MSSDERLIEFAPNVWIVEGPAVSFFGFPYPTRMAVIRLTEGDDYGRAWIWSPVEISDELASEVEARAGKVKYIMSPNKIHHIFLKQWTDRYPDAIGMHRLDKLIIAHGSCVEHGASEVIMKALYWI